VRVTARTITHSVLAAVAIATAAAPGACPANSGACAARSAWMPDVAQRRAELEARFARFASEAETNARGRAGVQWWRGAAARPAVREER
jgi:hypothetical protein